MGPRQQKAGKPKATPGRQKPKKSTAQSRAKTRKSVKPEAVERDPKRVSSDGNRLGPQPDYEAREAEFREKETKLRARPVREWKGRPWGFDHIDERKLDHFRVWCGEREFREWLNQREWFAGRGDWGAIGELVALDLAYVARHKTTLEIWKDLAAAGSPLARNWISRAFVPVKRKKYRSRPFRAEFLRAYCHGLRERDEAHGDIVFDMARDWWKKFAGEDLEVENLEKNIVMSKKGPLQAGSLHSQDVIGRMAELILLDTRVIQSELSILRDSCERCHHHRIDDWWTWKKSDEFKLFRRRCLEHWALISGPDPAKRFEALIETHNELVERRDPPSSLHCKLRLNPHGGALPCPCETRLSRWKSDSANVLEFVNRCRLMLEKLPQDVRWQLLSQV